MLVPSLLPVPSVSVSQPKKLTFWLCSPGKGLPSEAETKSATQRDFDMEGKGKDIEMAVYGVVDGGMKTRA